MMIRRLRLDIVLVGLFLSLFFATVHVVYASDTVTGVVDESGFSGIILTANGEKTGVKYNTGRETKYTPSDYRALKGDTVTLTYYAKPRRNGGEILAVSTMTLVKKDPNRKDLNSPAEGVIQEVGRRKIRFDFPAVGQVVSMEKKRRMKTSPDGWKPSAGDKVVVTFAKVKARFFNKMVLVISKIEKAE